MGKTEIYGTIGPACAEQMVLTEMFRFGMTGIRLNLSHIELEECREWTEMIKEASRMAGKRPRLLIDLQGPELRVGSLGQPLELPEGENIILSKRAGIPMPDIVFQSLRAGQEILLDDGKLQLEVIETSKAIGEAGTSEEVRAGKESGTIGPAESTVCCKVIRGGILQSKKSIALPGTRLNLPVLTESDRRNIRGARSHGVTGVMLPFVRSAEDLKELKQELCAADAGSLEIFAKIENMEGVSRLEELLPFADQIVVARGDLGNSMPLWELPSVQAQIAKTCRQAGKPFMIVTQMLASMEGHPVPTRAELSDVFRAVAEGAASVMVTGETAVGKYPAEAIRYLSNTVKAAETYLGTVDK